MTFPIFMRIASEYDFELIKPRSSAQKVILSGLSVSPAVKLNTFYILNMIGVESTFYSALAPLNPK